MSSLEGWSVCEQGGPLRDYYSRTVPEAADSTHPDWPGLLCALIKTTEALIRMNWVCWIQRESSRSNGLTTDPLSRAVESCADSKKKQAWNKQCQKVEINNLWTRLNTNRGVVNTNGGSSLFGKRIWTIFHKLSSWNGWGIVQYIDYSRYVTDLVYLQRSCSINWIIKHTSPLSSHKTHTDTRISPFL